MLIHLLKAYFDVEFDGDSKYAIRFGLARKRKFLFQKNCFLTEKPAKCINSVSK